MNEFTINKFLSLRLEGGKTNIYVSNKKFIQCKYVILNIPIDVSNDDEIQSSKNSLNEVNLLSEAVVNLSKNYEK